MTSDIHLEYKPDSRVEYNLVIKFKRIKISNQPSIKLHFVEYVQNFLISFCIEYKKIRYNSEAVL